MGIVKNLFLRIVLRIIGVCSFLSGVVLLIGALGAFLDGDIVLAIFGMVLGIGLVAGGVALFLVTTRKVEEVEELDEDSVEVRNETLIPLVVNNTASAVQNDALDALLVRSSNVVATLKDLVHHDTNQTADGLSTHIADMLLEQRSLSEWNPPRISARILGRNNVVWLNCEEDLSGTDMDTMCGIEMDLNLARTLARTNSCVNANPEQIRAAARSSLFEELSFGQARWDPAGDIEVAYPDESIRISSGEWVARMTPIRFLEDTPFKMRMVYDLDSNVRMHTSVIGMVVPRPVCFDSISENQAHSCALARSWAFRSALVVAEHAFTNTISRVIVNVRDRREDRTTNILSLDLSRETLRQMQDFCVAHSPEEGALPTVDYLAAKIDTNEYGAWFEPIELLFNPIVENLSDASRRASVELSQSPAPPALKRYFHIEQLSDLGISENASRLNAFNELMRTFADRKPTTEDLVSELVRIREHAGDDTSLADAALRASNALVEGTLDASDTQALERIFVDGTALDEAHRHMLELVGDNASISELDPAKLEEILTTFETALTSIEQQGIYTDTDTTIYRFFGSYSERVLFNRELDDHTRKVVLIPDAYFLAHLNCARILTLLGRLEEANAHENVLDRIAPTSISAGLQRVRTLEQESKIFEAAELIKRLIELSCGADDVAVCFYRLAYMQWKLGHSDLAAACYVRSLHWANDFNDQTEAELKDLLANTEGLARPSSKEAEELLKSVGIPLGVSDSWCSTLLGAAVICCDSNIFSVAQPLTANLFDLTRNDAIISIYRSMAPFS